MASKARYFKDVATLQKIMRSSNPYEIKKLGRQVKLFNDELWKKECKSIMKRGILAKFTTHKPLLSILQSTDKNVIVEASVYDKFWGSGLNIENSCKIDQKQWPGKNFLGQILSGVRDQLSKDR